MSGWNIINNVSFTLYFMSIKSRKISWFVVKDVKWNGMKHITATVEEFFKEKEERKTSVHALVCDDIMSWGIRIHIFWLMSLSSLVDDIVFAVQLFFCFKNDANTSCIKNDIFPFNDQTQNATKRKEITRYLRNILVCWSKFKLFCWASYFNPQQKHIYCNKQRRPHSNFRANELNLLRYDLAGTRPDNMKISLLLMIIQDNLPENEQTVPHGMH